MRTRRREPAPRFRAVVLTNLPIHIACENPCPSNELSPAARVLRPSLRANADGKTGTPCRSNPGAGFCGTRAKRTTVAMMTTECVEPVRRGKIPPHQHRLRRSSMDAPDQEKHVPNRVCGAVRELPDWHRGSDHRRRGAASQMRPHEFLHRSPCNPRARRDECV